MKIKNLFFTGLIAAAVISACSKSNDGPDGMDTGDNTLTYMKLRLVGDSGSSYEPANYSRTQPGLSGTQNGTPGENAINSAIVLLADENGNIIETAVPGLTSTATGAVTDQFRVSLGTYYVYVIANPTDELKLWSAGESVSDRTITDITATMMSEQYAKNGSFLMFNECNGTDDVQGQKITVTQENVFGKPAVGDGAIKLDRLAVKITSTAINKVDFEEFTFEDISSVELKGFVLLNGIHKSFLQQRWSAPKPDPEQSYPPYKNKLITPEADYGYFYATPEDYYMMTMDGVYDLSHNTPWDTQPVYCMENGSEPGGEFMFGTATGLIYRWEVKNNRSDTRAGKNCFYGYDGKYFSTLEAIQAAYPGVFNEDKIPSDDEAERIREFEAAKTQLSEDVGIFRAKYNVRVFQNGFMYYTHYIKDQNYIDESGEPYYAVMRNTVYCLNVIKLLKIGEDIPFGWSPDPDPTDPASGLYMEVKVDVNKWVISSEDIELE